MSAIYDPVLGALRSGAAKVSALIGAGTAGKLSLAAETEAEADALIPLQNGAAQIISTTCPSSDGTNLGGLYFDLRDADDNAIRVWWDVGSSVAPAVPAGGRLVKVTLGGASRTAGDVANYTSRTLSADGAVIAPRDDESNGDLFIIQKTPGVRTAPSAGTSGMTWTVLTEGAPPKTITGVGFPWQTRRPRGTKIALLGDSITNYNIRAGGDNGNRPQYMNYGWFQIANAFWLGGAFRLTGDFGVSGERIDDMYPRIATQVAPSNPHYCLVLAGTNDLANSLVATAGDTPASAYARLVKVWDRLEDYGITPIAATIMPGAASGSDAVNIAIRSFNQLLREEAQKRGYAIVDMWSVVADVTTGTWASADYHAGDNIHPSEQGAWLMAGAVGAALSEDWLDNIDVLPISDGVTTNQLITNPLMLGDVSGKATGVTGQTGPTYTKEARVDGFPGEWQQVDQNNTAGAAQVRQVIASGFNTGDILVGCFEVQLTNMEGSAVGLRGYVLPLGGDNNWGGRSIWIASTDEVWPSAAQDKRAVLWTYPIRVPANTTSVRAQIEFVGVGDASVFRVGRMAVYRIPESEVPQNVSFSDESVF